MPNLKKYPAFLTYNSAMRFFILFIFLFSISNGFSQTTRYNTDSTKKVFRHSPRTALVLSAIIPGLGQAYNKKYWKMPIVYATMGTTIYLFQQYNTQFRQYKRAYIAKDTAKAFNFYFPSSNDVNKYDTTQLRTQEERYRKFRDLNFILTFLFYTLNIADAYVDAHLMSFDVSDNLSMKILPSLNFYSRRQKPYAGLTLSFRFWVSTLYSNSYIRSLPIDIGTISY